VEPENAVTLFIACLLIYEFELDWKFYIAAVAIWMGHVAFLHGALANLQNALNNLLSRVKRFRGE
jgi:hypothetical protein